MKKLIRMNESELIGLIKKIIKEQSLEGTSKEGGSRETDYFGQIILPVLKQNGFKMGDDSGYYGRSKCPYYCCMYYFFPDHSNGVNVGLKCGEHGGDPTKGAWKIEVYYGGNKGYKTFDANDNGARQAVQYAINLKNKLFPNK